MSVMSRVINAEVTDDSTRGVSVERRTWKPELEKKVSEQRGSENTKQRPLFRYDLL